MTNTNYPEQDGVGELPEKTIMVCNKCDHPLLWTFAFAYCEYYCLSCGAKGGVFDAGYEVKLTPELKAEKATINHKWGQVKKWLVEAKFWRKDCPKCKGDEPHYKHLTKKEQAKAEWARNKLVEWSTQ